ncbi:manganese efflux pump [Paenibacillus sp. GCM10027627]|uniref:manganese efflux pump n=1 Tax=unclassified Paenibacillus TaxID=185978 RepID=UPI00363EA1D9
MIAHLISMVVLAFAVSLDGFGVGVTYGLRKIRIPFLSVFIIACCSGFIIWVSMQAGGWLSGFVSESAAKGIGAAILISIGCWALIQLIRAKGLDEEEASSSKIKADADEDESSKAKLSTVTETAGNYAKSAEGKADLSKSAEATAHSASSFSAAAELRRSVEATTGSAHPANSSSATASSTKSEAAQLIKLELKSLGLVIQILRTPQAADVDRSGIISASEAVMLGIALSLDSLGAGLGAALLGLPALLTAFVIAAASAIFLVGGTRLGLRFAANKGMHALSYLPGILLIMMGIMKLL